MSIGFGTWLNQWLEYILLFVYCDYLYNLYHDKSLLNHHWGEYVFSFSKQQANPSIWNTTVHSLKICVFFLVSPFFLQPLKHECSFVDPTPSVTWGADLDVSTYRVRPTQRTTRSRGKTKKHEGFLKWWYPQIIHFNRVFLIKKSILGYPYFMKHLHERLRHWCGVWRSEGVFDRNIKVEPPVTSRYSYDPVGLFKIIAVRSIDMYRTCHHPIIWLYIHDHIETFLLFTVFGG